MHYESGSRKTKLRDSLYSIGLIVVLLISVQKCSDSPETNESGRPGNPSILKKSGPTKSPLPQKSPTNDPTVYPSGDQTKLTNGVVTPKNATLLDFDEKIKTDSVLYTFYSEYSLINQFAPPEKPKLKYLIYATKSYTNEGWCFNFREFFNNFQMNFVNAILN